MSCCYYSEQQERIMMDDVVGLQTVEDAVALRASGYYTYPACKCYEMSEGLQ